MEWRRKSFHSETNIWPIGYRSVRYYASRRLTPWPPPACLLSAQRYAEERAYTCLEGGFQRHQPRSTTQASRACCCPVSSCARHWVARHACA